MTADPHAETCTAHIVTEHSGDTHHCTLEAGHTGGQFDGDHAGPVNDKGVRYCWSDNAIGAVPHQSPTAPAGLGVSATPSNTDLRERIADTLALRENPPGPDGRAWYRDEHYRESFLETADAVLAVLPPPADRVAVQREADWIEEHCPDHGCVEPETDGCHCEIAERLRRQADEAPLSPYYEHPECGFHWHGRDGMDIPMQDGQPVCPRCELAKVQKKLDYTQRRRDEVGAECKRRGKIKLEQAERIARLERQLDEVQAQLGAEILRAGQAEATLERIQRVIRRLANHAVGFQDMLDDSDRDPWAKTVGADIAGLRRLADEAQQQEPESGCAHCGGDHSWDDCQAYTAVVADETQQEPPVHGESVAHLAGLHDDEPDADARQDETATDETAPKSTEPRPCRTFISGGTVWCCEEGETDCPCVCHQPAVDARQDGVQDRG